MSQHTIKPNMFDNSSSSDIEPEETNAQRAEQRRITTERMMNENLPMMFCTRFTYEVSQIPEDSTVLESHRQYVSLTKKHEVKITESQTKDFETMVEQFNLRDSSSCDKLLECTTVPECTFGEQLSDLMHAVTQKNLAVLSYNLSEVYSESEEISKWYEKNIHKQKPQFIQYKQSSLPKIINDISKLLTNRKHAFLINALAQEQKGANFSPEYWMDLPMEFSGILSHESVQNGAVRSSTPWPFRSPPLPGVSTASHTHFLINHAIQELTQLTAVVYHDKSTGTKDRLEYLYPSPFLVQGSESSTVGDTLRNRVFQAPIYVAQVTNFGDKFTNTIFDAPLRSEKIYGKNRFFSHEPNGRKYYEERELAKRVGIYTDTSLQNARKGLTDELAKNLTDQELAKVHVEYEGSTILSDLATGRKVEFEGVYYLRHTLENSSVSECLKRNIHILSFSDLMVFVSTYPDSVMKYRYFIISFSSQTIMLVPPAWITNHVYLTDKMNVHVAAYTEVTTAQFPKLPRFCSMFYIAAIKELRTHRAEEMDFKAIYKSMKGMSKNKTISRKHYNTVITRDKFKILYKQAYNLEIACDPFVLVGSVKASISSITEVLTAMGEYGVEIRTEEDEDLGNMDYGDDEKDDFALSLKKINYISFEKMKFIEVDTPDDENESQDQKVSEEKTNSLVDTEDKDPSDIQDVNSE